MPCPDCERAIAELRAELRALERRQQAMLDAMRKFADNFEAKNHALLVRIDRQVRDVFAQIKAVARATEKEEPPRCH